MSQQAKQVKMPESAKRELEIFAALKGRSQTDVLAEAWSEYLQRHGHEMSPGLKWAQAVLGDAAQTAIDASGMDQADINELRDAFG